MLSTRKAPAAVRSGKLTIRTECGLHFVDLTPEAHAFVRNSGLRQGLALIYSQHTTAAIVLAPSDPRSLQDLVHFLNTTAPPDAEYRHNDFTVRTVNMTEDESPNGHSHCQHLLLRTSETIPIVDGELLIAPGQGLYLIELDHPRTRDVIFHLIGE
ncbi:MAG TPA: secondary thiamine-phosphate synthase enzyme YjbQ [Dehalococcoidia bacterium]|nr:secondary thiamine-phosphate synthase enzyme YjbQ [Dehalococcoidia bacterium]